MIRKRNWKALGFQVVLEAENGRDALARAEANPLVEMLADIKMLYMTTSPWDSM